MKKVKGVRRNRQGKYLVDTRWPDGMRTRRKMPNEDSAIALNLKIKVACADEERIWKNLRKSLRMERHCNVVHSVIELIKRYMNEYVAIYNSNVRHKNPKLLDFAAFMGDVSVDRIDVSSVSRFLALKKNSGLENTTVNKYASAVSHMMKWAEDQGIIETNPLVKLRRLDEPEYFAQRPSGRVIDAVFSKIDSDILPILIFIRETGCRKNEAFSLREEQLDFSREVVTFHTSQRRGTQTKNKKTRRVPLTDAAIDAIQSVKKQGTTVFYNPHTGSPWRHQTLYRFWDNARQLAAKDNMDDAYLCLSLRIHGLRHKYAIMLAERGCPMHFISEVLGHYSIEFTRRRYARFSPESATESVRDFLKNPSKTPHNGTKQALGHMS